MIWTIKKAFYRCFHGAMKCIVPLLRVPVPKVINGAGCTNQLAEIVRSRGIGRVMVVTDRVITELGLPNNLLKALAKNEVLYTIYDDVRPNPTIQDIENGLIQYQKEDCEGIIAFGGGSPMDCAKMIGARAVDPNRPISKMRGMFKLRKKLPPLFAVPTTAGSGSETTVAAVVTDPEAHEKYAVTDLKLVPEAAALDPELMLGLPPHITAATGMDALTHAIEAYIGLHGTRFTNEKAENATRLIFENLEAVVQDGSNLRLRENMAHASFFAGAAFTRASLGYVHAIAHNMGGLYGVPHGVANAIILPHVLEISRAKAEKKLAKLAVAAGIGRKNESAETLSRRFVDQVKELSRRIGIPTKIKELQEKDIPLIARRALKEANPFYPVPAILNRKECESLVGRLLP